MGDGVRQRGKEQLKNTEPGQQSDSDGNRAEVHRAGAGPLTMDPTLETQAESSDAAASMLGEGQAYVPGMDHQPPQHAAGLDAQQGAFAMGQMASSLPDYRAPHNYPGVQRFAASGHPQHVNPQSPVGQYPGGAAPGGHPQSPTFSTGYGPPMQPPHPAAASPPYFYSTPSGHMRGNMSGHIQQPVQGPPFYPGQPQHPQGYYYYGQSYMPGNPQMYPGAQSHMDGGMLQNVGFHGKPIGIPAAPQAKERSFSSGGSPVSRLNASINTSSIPSAPRGPPRKPKQSGHALWVGNLPPGTKIVDLKDHFSKEARNDIESVFLISKSNCAFVNYRGEESCAAAVNRFHESKFQGVRLVCRLRKGSTSAPGTPTSAGPVSSQSQTAVEAINQNRETSLRAEESLKLTEGASKVTDKYFIVKSLTVEDLELSARNGIWATQSHNEEALNKAFESVESVYLIFSANKSGEYFGYARMASVINDESALELEWKPRAEVKVDDPELPRAIPTPATEFAPKGRIIDDSARGTIFWEADTQDQEVVGSGDTEKQQEETEEEGKSEQDEDEGSQGRQGETHSFGKPFRVEWLSTNRLPFYRTRGLRNPWNGNREVKIARDGTELETNVGRQLVALFHRPGMGRQPMSPGLPPIGYPNIRPG